MFFFACMMNKQLASLLLFVWIFLVLKPIEQEMQLSIQGLQPSQQGKTLYIGIWLPGNVDFPHDQKPDIGLKAQIKSTAFTLSRKLAPGKYAVTVYVDENGNGRLDKNMFGAPKEPFGVSNNVVPKLSAPKLEECLFDMNKSHNVRIQLQ